MPEALQNLTKDTTDEIESSLGLGGKPWVSGTHWLNETSGIVESFDQGANMVLERQATSPWSRRLPLQRSVCGKPEAVLVDLVGTKFSNRRRQDSLCHSGIRRVVHTALDQFSGLTEVLVKSWRREVESVR